MQITKIQNKIIYSCSLCGHECIEYSDGRTSGAKFIEDTQEVTTYEPVVEKTISGIHTGAKQIKHKAYICPACSKRQIEIK